MEEKLEKLKNGRKIRKLCKCYTRDVFWTMLVAVEAARNGQDSGYILKEDLVELFGVFG